MHFLKKAVLTLVSLMLLSDTVVYAQTYYDGATKNVSMSHDGYAQLKEYLIAGDYRLTTTIPQFAYAECLEHGRQWLAFDDTEKFWHEKGFKLIFPKYKYRILGHKTVILAGGGSVDDMGFVGRLYLDRIGDYKGSMAGAPGFFGRKVDIAGTNNSTSQWSSFTLIGYDDNDNITEIVSAHKESCHKKITIGGIAIGTSVGKLRSLYGDPATKEGTFPYNIRSSIWKYPAQGWEFEIVDNLVESITIYPDSDRRFDDTGLGPKSSDVDFIAHFGKVRRYSDFRVCFLNEGTSIWLYDDGRMKFMLTPMSI